MEAIIRKTISKAISTGQAAFTHGNSGRAREWKTDPGTEGAIIELYCGKYARFNFSHIREKLAEDEGVQISYKTLWRILSEAGFKSPKRHKAKGRKNEHSSGPRKDNFGEMFQIDASIHPWFGEGLPKATLHGAIDDATGTVMGLWLDKDGMLAGYYEMMTYTILTKYGIPACFCGNNRTIFEFRKLSEKDKTIDGPSTSSSRGCASSWA